MHDKAPIPVHGNSNDCSPPLHDQFEMIIISFCDKNKLLHRESEITNALFDSNEVDREQVSKGKLLFNFHVFLYNLNKKIPDQNPEVNEEGFQPMYQKQHKHYTLSRAILTRKFAPITQDSISLVSHD
ncbi:hypothetical protein ACH5RR_015689 [Cinchona calisaya]|uniref:Uncharacterized protein n=1 Tax=Cinchona calisaya TaxID=153742 RepID=A0ABD2ZXA1_9GENT